MHRTLCLEEILLNIFGHCVPPAETSRFTTDLVALARTCRTFKEPALDILWEDLNEISVLVRCLPGACRRNFNHACYSLIRPLTEADWNILRGYARRVRHIRSCSDERVPLDLNAMSVVFSQTPFAGSLFPNVRSIVWEDFETFPVAHAAVPSLVSLHLNTSYVPCPGLPLSTEVFDAVEERCPNIKQFRLYNHLYVSLDTTVSRLLCRWKNLRCVDCRQVTLSVDTILHLCSAATLTHLSFILSPDFDSQISRFGPSYVFSGLATLNLESRYLRTVTNFISRVQLPAIKDFSVISPNYAPRRDTQTYWTTVQRACTSNVLARLSLSCAGDGTGELVGLDERLTLNDLRPCRDFGNLRQLNVDIAWAVELTDADLLDLVSTSPQLEELGINRDSGWKLGDNGGGVTLSGLVQLLRQCPSLVKMAFVVDTRTFTHVPRGLALSFPPRRGIFFNFLDSYISTDIIPGLVSTFTKLGLGPYCFVGGNFELDALILWESVQNEMVSILSCCG